MAHQKKGLRHTKNCCARFCGGCGRANGGSLNGGFVSARDVFWVLLGVGVLLLFKYAVFGLDLWDAKLHPGRSDAPGRFSQPLLGLLALKGNGGACEYCGG